MKQMQALQTIDRGTDKILPGQLFTPKDQKQAELLIAAGAAAWLDTEKPPKGDKRYNGLSASELIEKIKTVSTMEELGPLIFTGSETEITAALVAKLKELCAGTPAPEKKKPSAEEAIAAIGKCTTIDEVKEFFKNEDRVTVKDAAKAQIKALKDKEAAGKK